MEKAEVNENRGGAGGEKSTGGAAMSLVTRRAPSCSLFFTENSGTRGVNLAITPFLLEAGHLDQLASLSRD